MVDVLTEIVIDRPRELVAAYAANPEHAPEWYVNIKSAEWQTDQQLRVGAKIAFKADFLGKQLAYVYEIMEHIPGTKLVMRTADGPFPMETMYTWESVGDSSTRMKLRNRGGPAGFSKLFAPFMAMMMRKANMKDLKAIKSILERTSFS